MQLQPTHISNANAIIKLFGGPFINIDKYRSIVSINKSPRGVLALTFLWKNVPTCACTSANVSVYLISCLKIRHRSDFLAFVCDSNKVRNTKDFQKQVRMYELRSTA